MIIDEEDGSEQCMYDTGKRWMTGWGGGGSKDWKMVGLKELKVVQ